MYLTSSMLSLLPTASGAGTNILSILAGGTSAAGSGVDPVTALQTALTGESKGVQDAANQPQTKREIANFRAAVAAAKTPQELLANPDARKVLLTANGLGSQSDYAALATKALMSDTSTDGSLASKLSNTQWLATAKTYDFANQGLAVLKRSSVIDGIASGYAEVKWREGLDAATPGLSNAIDFRSRAATITSADQILGDSTLREVVTTALGIPKEIAYQSLQAQENAITTKLDVAKLKDPKFVEQFTRRYLIAARDAAAASTGTTSGVASLFA